MPAIQGIVAKLMVIIDSILSVFVDATTSPTAVGCNITVVNAQLTACGVALVDGVASLLYQLTLLGEYIFAALGAVPYA